MSVERRDERTRSAVRDSGDGIPPEERETIFERFRRLGERSAPGAGLGLYLSRGIVEAHGSELTVGDAPEGGAEFAFELVRRGSTSVTGITERSTARV